MNPGVRSGPHLAYSLSHLVFGLTSLARGLLSYVDGDAVASAFFLVGGGTVVAFVAYETIGSGSSNVPDEWGSLVYATAAGATLFAVATVWPYL